MLCTNASDMKKIMILLERNMKPHAALKELKISDANTRNIKMCS
jgi:hypothetical protein